MMHTASLNSYRKAEFAGFMKDYLAALAKHDTSAVAERVDALQVAYAAMSSDYQMPVGSAYTQAIEQLDKERDACLTGIRGVAAAYMQHYDPALADAAAALLRSIDKYGKNIQRMNYQAQTVVLEKLAADWAEPEAQAHLAALGLKAWAEQMRTVNERFAQMRQNRSEERAADDSETMDLHRPAVTEAYRALNTHILAHHTIAPSDHWARLIGEHNAIVAEYETLLQRRSAKRSPTEGA